MALYPMRTYLDECDIHDMSVAKGKVNEILSQALGKMPGDFNFTDFSKYIWCLLLDVSGALHAREDYLNERPKRARKYNQLVETMRTKEAKANELKEQLKPLEDEIKALADQIKELEREEAEQSTAYRKRIGDN